MLSLTLCIVSSPDQPCICVCVCVLILQERELERIEEENEIGCAPEHNWGCSFGSSPIPSSNT